ncbi:MAG: DUF58 domain-containing protein [Proteobacteria bacterium]|nr:DUF58 domain-containing protein [Pseudomonadota bacterium]
MAQPRLNDTPFPPQAELAAFARVAGRWLTVDTALAGDSRASRRQRGSGLMFLEHRDYQPGDDIRRIDWPLTARLERPILREFQAERRADWLLCVDASSSMAVAHGAKWRCAVGLAAAMSYTLLEVGHRVGVAVFADTVMSACLPGRGSAQYLRICRALAAHHPGARGAGARLAGCARQLAGISTAMIFSDFLVADFMAGDLRRVAASCVETHAIQVGDPRDWDLPRTRALELIDVESGERTIWTRDASAARRIEVAAAQHTRSLARLCAAAGILFSTADVSTPWQHSLLRHLGRRSPR